MTRSIAVAGVLLCIAMLVPSRAWSQQTRSDEEQYKFADTASQSSASQSTSETSSSEPPGSEPLGSEPPVPLISTWDFVRMVLILAGVIAVIYGLFFVLKRTSAKRVAENDLIRVLGSRILSGSRSLHLVEVGSSLFLIGSSDGGVALISEITSDESVDRIRLQAAELDSTEKRSFRDALYEVFKPKEEGPLQREAFNFTESQKERIRKLR